MTDTLFVSPFRNDMPRNTLRHHFRSDIDDCRKSLIHYNETLKYSQSLGIGQVLDIAEIGPGHVLGLFKPLVPLVREGEPFDHPSDQEYVFRQQVRPLPFRRFRRFAGGTVVAQDSPYPFAGRNAGHGSGVFVSFPFAVRGAKPPAFSRLHGSMVVRVVFHCSPLRAMRAAVPRGFPRSSETVAFRETR